MSIAEDDAQHRKSSPLAKEKLSVAPQKAEQFASGFTRITAAVARSFLLFILVITPSMLISGTTDDSNQMVVLLALFGALIVFIEYASTYPSMIEFRYAAPFNRVRFASLFGTVFLLSLLLRDHSYETELSIIVNEIGVLIGNAIDFPLSPVRIMILTAPHGTSVEHIDHIRAAAGLSYLISLTTLAIFLILIRIKRWPNRTKTFNFWTNLPTFDPTMGGDVVLRLKRDARVNIILGFVLPFLMPVVAGSASNLFNISMADSMQTMVWMIALWAFLPVSVFMRGIAMNRIAAMIDEKRSQRSDAVKNGLLHV